MNIAIQNRIAKKTSHKASIPYEPWLKERLTEHPQEASLYLQTAMEDEDPRVFLLAFKDVADAYGVVGKLAKATGLNRENLFRMLSASGNPELSTLYRVLHAFGLRLKVEPTSPSGFPSGPLIKKLKRGRTHGSKPDAHQAKSF